MHKTTNTPHISDLVTSLPQAPLLSAHRFGTNFTKIATWFTECLRHYKSNSYSRYYFVGPICCSLHWV